MTDHDHSYKLLFSHPRMVEDLLRGFVHEEWVERIDFSTLERVSGSYVSTDLREREDDIVWRVRLRGEWIYVYLLLEFQSRPDPFMALRMLVYVGLLYQELVKQKQLTGAGRLPPVLPLVLYNGEKAWRAPLQMEELIEPLPGGLADYRPRMRYLLLDESAYPAEELEPLANLAAALFRMERSGAPEELRRVVQLLVTWLRAPEQAGLRRAFTVWIKRVLLPVRMPEMNIPQVSDLNEVETMLAEHVKEWTEQWKAAGFQQGMQQGTQEGESVFLIRLLEKKFGPLGPSVIARIQAAEPEQLLTWYLGGARVDCAGTEGRFRRCGVGGHVV